ncbi:MAG: hypothetical protein LC118_03075 [Dehalococcoidia bacterium]|nr:hypothetical protein [Dehalococcoidia bacterium]
MAVLTRLEIEKIARRHFGDLGETYVAVATAIALAESGGETDVTNDNYPRWQAADSPARYDYGLMQINSMHGYNPLALMSPDVNMAAARAIYNMQGWNAWTTWRWGMAQPFLQQTTPPEEPAPAPVVEDTAPGQGSIDVSGLPFTQFDTKQREEFLRRVYSHVYGYTSVGVQMYDLPAPEGRRRVLVDLPAS